MAESRRPPFVRLIGLTGVGDLDAIILSYCNETVLGILMSTVPDHPLLAPNGKCWYNLIAMELHNYYTPVSPPYQIDWPGLLPTDYRSLWYALHTPAYYSYEKMTEIMKALGWSVRRYGNADVPGKNALEAALDMTAIPTDDSHVPYQWSNAIISLLAEHLVQFIHRVEQYNPAYIVLSMNRLTNARYLIDFRVFDWIMPAIASRGCTQLVIRLAERLGTPVTGSTSHDRVVLAVSQWILTSTSYTPEMNVLPSSTMDSPPLRLRLPTLTAAVVDTIWSTYVDDKALDNVSAGTVNRFSYQQQVERVVTLACRDVALLTSVLDVLAVIPNMRLYISTGFILSLLLESPYRHVDDYTTLYVLLDWLEADPAVNATRVDSTGHRRRAVDYVELHVHYYYAERIKTYAQSKRFLGIGLSKRGLDLARECHDIFLGYKEPVYTAVHAMFPYRQDADIWRAINCMRIYINGRVDGDRRGTTTTGVLDAIEMLQSDEMGMILGLIVNPDKHDDYSRANRVGVLTMLVTAAQSMPILEAAYELFDITAMDGKVLRSALPADPNRYHEMMLNLGKVGEVLILVARDPYSHDDALPWLMRKLSVSIPDAVDEWGALQQKPGSKGAIFPREGVWNNFVLPAVQVPDPLVAPMAYSPRMLQLITFSTMPNQVNGRYARYNTLPVDLRREVDGGLSLAAVRSLMGAVKRGNGPRGDVLKVLLPYTWDPMVLGVMVRTMVGLRI